MPNGISRNRLSLILAVLAKHARLRMHAVDCHTNVVGGLQVPTPHFCFIARVCLHSASAIPTLLAPVHSHAWMLPQRLRNGGN